jgi:hypothetical protein
VFRTSGVWPRTRPLYRHPMPAQEWPPAPVVMDQVGVRSCVRRGAAIDLVLERGRGTGHSWCSPSPEAGKSCSGSHHARGSKPTGDHPTVEPHRWDVAVPRCGAGRVTARRDGGGGPVLEVFKLDRIHPATVADRLAEYKCGGRTCRSGSQRPPVGRRVRVSVPGGSPGMGAQNPRSPPRSPQPPAPSVAAVTAHRAQGAVPGRQ